MKLENLTNNVIWNITNKTEEEIKGYVNNYCKDMNVYYSNLVITDSNVTFTTYSKISYEALAKKLIAERYAIEDELKLHREEKENPNNEEYLEYVRYVKECLATAKEWTEERNKVIGG